MDSRGCPLITLPADTFGGLCNLTIYADVARWSQERAISDVLWCTTLGNCGRCIKRDGCMRYGGGFGNVHLDCGQWWDGVWGWWDAVSVRFEDPLYLHYILSSPARCERYRGLIHSITYLKKEELYVPRNIRQQPEIWEKSGGKASSYLINPKYSHKYTGDASVRHQTVKTWATWTEV
jgi:hypothetical protein